MIAKHLPKTGTLQDFTIYSAPKLRLPVSLNRIKGSGDSSYEIPIPKNWFDIIENDSYAAEPKVAEILEKAYRKYKLEQGEDVSEDFKVRILTEGQKDYFDFLEKGKTTLYKPIIACSLPEIVFLEKQNGRCR